MKFTPRPTSPKPRRKPSHAYALIFEPNGVRISKITATTGEIVGLLHDEAEAYDAAENIRQIIQAERDKPTDQQTTIDNLKRAIKLALAQGLIQDAGIIANRRGNG